MLADVLKPPAKDAIDAVLHDYLQPILSHIGISSWPTVKAEFDKAIAELAELRAKADKWDKHEAGLPGPPHDVDEFYREDEDEIV